MNSGEVVIGESRMNKRPQMQEVGTNLKKHKQQKHLYLVLDDWEKGFTIRKIDVDTDSPDLLSDPPVLRLVSPSPGYRMIFTSIGSHILAVSNRHPATLAYDTDTQGLAAGPSLPEALLGASNILLPAADTLYAFGYYLTEKPQSVEVMSSSAKNQSCLIPSKHWSWRSIVSPFTIKERICSYAVHPDGRTIFVSAFLCCTGSPCNRTFSFNIDDCEWRCHGEWVLPFEGQGCFDSDLDAWVGLHEDGYIGTCQVVSSTSGSTTESEMQRQLDWKMAKDKLWSEEEQLALCPTLTSMGNARFCLVDCVKGTGFYGCILHIITFRLRYDRKGELEIFDRNTRSCPVSKHLMAFSPVAFWM